jgi:hypothetical protein
VGQEADVGRGHVATLLDWPRVNLDQHGRTFTAPALVERVSGGPLNIAPYIH